MWPIHNVIKLSDQKKTFIGCNLNGIENYHTKQNGSKGKTETGRGTTIRVHAYHMPNPTSFPDTT